MDDEPGIDGLKMTLLVLGVLAGLFLLWLGFGLIMCVSETCG